jgi:hypothetical protein
LNLILKVFKEKKNLENFEFKLIFDTENDGFTAAKFHEKCDLIENILVVVENTKSERFGGFTSLKFDPKSD